ncbi:hypothetical protein HZI73_12305 [Vallitalea pronyensis]|uniref:Peptidase S41 n=1 Tax=Vallitalea pronyensis TaxID=1348613 RepID=A0A8J8MJW3_9FIRM|nr:S41 family peptidase [Vallitalea pronyensis]QUI23025.1 hypothetical protein HZI73_12305 [Vallitalea pronyensis]
MCLSTRIKVTIGMLLSIVFLVACSGLSQNPSDHNIVDHHTKWKEDINYLSKHLQANHKNMYHTITKEDYNKEKDTLIAELPQLTEMEKIIRLKGLVARIGDGHTAVYVNTPIHVFPFKIMTFEDGVYIINASEAYKNLIGAKIKQIGHLPVEDILVLLSNMVSKDNVVQQKSHATDYLLIAEYLQAYGIIDHVNQADMIFQTIEGEDITVSIESTMDLDKLQWASIGKTYKAIRDLLYLKNTAEPYWFAYLPKDKTIYFQYNQCFSLENDPIDAFIQRLIKFMDEHQVDTFVIDMRHNSGGNSTLIEPLITKLATDKAINQLGKLYVVIGKRTFSSAVLNVLTIQDKTEAILIGKPTGGRPNHYGEVKQFTLPHLGYEVTYSTKYFTYSQHDTDAIYPDIEVTYTFDDFIHGIDPVLQIILEQ